MNIKSGYGKILTGISKLFGVDTAKKFDTRLRFQRDLNLNQPKSLADKVTYLELHDPSPLAPKCTDKYAVRQYVEEKGKMDKKKCFNEMSKWLKTTYGTYSMEPHYLKIPHRIYAEEYLAYANKLIDYKFHCMNGIPQFVLVCCDRVTTELGNNVSRHILDMNWKPLKGLDETADVVKKPEHLEQMIEIARKLSADFKFVRVDLYDINGKVYFGELTFSPTNGVFSHYTQEFLDEMGAKLVI